MSEIQLLKDSSTYPSDEVLQEALGSSYITFSEFIRKLNGLEINTEWRYYNDGKAWLGKGIYKKKTVFWLSVWNGYFKLSLFFTDKTINGVSNLPVDKSLKKVDATVSKLKPIIIDIHDEKYLEDLITIIEYKRNLK